MGRKNGEGGGAPRWPLRPMTKGNYMKVLVNKTDYALFIHGDDDGGSGIIQLLSDP